MRLSLALPALLLVGSTAASVIGAPRHVEVKHTDAASHTNDPELYRRRGGGGGGSGGSGGGGGHSGGGGRSFGSSSSRTKTNSNEGGYSSKGSGVQPTYGGGRYYPGGAAVPYQSGVVTATGLTPFLLIGSALAFWPGVWLYGAYMYHYNTPYRFYNASSQANETREITCGCARYAVCGCEENNSTQYYNDLVGNGSYAPLNKSIVNVSRVNGTMTILINGTLPNGTTAAGEDSAAPGSMKGLVEAFGVCPVAVAVLATVYLL
ncbi:glycine-rich protein [Dactylonectria macrodidyma]|uniref:Glycine-rich protein n=1 Tax=Dactylonectria macrodidyma TaxID=307937 RepID=A0A9P9CXY6_9HYPO|nr:glycine-rich protein [Dactylonectria macrodidyma]